MAELERCQDESQGFSYVFLGCQKYGFRPFPAKMPQGVFEHLRAALALPAARRSGGLNNVPTAESRGLRAKS